MAQVTNFPTAYYYSAANKMYNLDEGYVGECTWYCHGRALETVGKTDNLSTGNARTWYSAAPVGSRRGPTSVPAVNSIACFDGNTTNPQGHVVFIESVVRRSSGEYYIGFSECNWYSDDRLSNQQIETPPNGTDGQLKSMYFWNEFRSRGPGASKK